MGKTEAQARPVTRIQRGRVRATIWANEVTQGEFRVLMYRECPGGTYDYTTSFTLGDLDPLEELLAAVRLQIRSQINGS